MSIAKVSDSIESVSITPARGPISEVTVVAYAAALLGYVRVTWSFEGIFAEQADGCDVDSPDTEWSPVHGLPAIHAAVTAAIFAADSVDWFGRTDAAEFVN